MLSQKKPYEDANYIKCLQSLKKAVDKDIINLTGNTSYEHLKNVQKMILYVPVQTTIALQAWSLLLPLLKGLKQILLKLKQEQYRVKAKFILRRMYINTNECFLSKQLVRQVGPPKGKKQLVLIFGQLFKEQNFKQLFEESQQNRKHIQGDQRSEIFKELLANYYKIDTMTEKYERRKAINRYIEQQLLVLEPTSFLEQICLNYIKKKTEITQNEQQCYLCCRIHFERATTSILTGYTETFNQQFKDYRWPLENQSICFHLTKTLIGFLNTTGGIIYVGLKQDKSKLVEIKGIQLSPMEKRKFLQFMHDTITQQIYPKEPDREEYQRKPSEHSSYYRKIQNQFNKEKSGINGYEYHINNYIDVDFMDVFDGNTFLNSLGTNHGHRLYVVRIKIKAGDPRQLYHVINTVKKVPEAFLRQDKSVKRKDMKEFHDLFYKRISGTDVRDKNQMTGPHSLCRFNPNMLLMSAINT